MIEAKSRVVSGPGCIWPGRSCEVPQSCPTLCNRMDCSLPSSSVHGIFQAIALEWIAISKVMLKIL